MAFGEYFRTEVWGLMDFGDVVVSRVRVDSAGATTEVCGVDAFQFKDGLVFENWHEADHELGQQLGRPSRRAKPRSVSCSSAREGRVWLSLDRP